MDHPTLLLQGMRVLIIGGGSRMGLATAQRVIAAGGEVILSSRTSAKLQEAVDGLNGDASFHVADASDPQEARRMLEDLAPLDHVVVTASAGNVPAGGITETTSEIAAAAFSRFWISYHALHFGAKVIRLGGSITLLSGSSGRRPVAGYGVWGTLHGSIESLARSAALELAPIRVNTVSPGGIGIRPDRQLAHHEGQFDDVAAMILAVMINPAVTGATIDVDGGERLGTWPPPLG